MNFKKVKTQKLLKFAFLYCPTVTVQSKQLLHIATPKYNHCKELVNTFHLSGHSTWRLPSFLSWSGWSVNHLFTDF